MIRTVTRNVGERGEPEHPSGGDVLAVPPRVGRSQSGGSVRRRGHCTLHGVLSIMTGTRRAAGRGAPAARRVGVGTGLLSPRGCRSPGVPHGAWCGQVLGAQRHVRDLAVAGADELVIPSLT